MNISRKKTILILIALLVLLALLANFNFIWINVKFTLNGRKITYEDGVTAESAKSEILPPNTMDIPSLDITAPVVYIEEKTEQAYQKALQSGVVHYPGTALPGNPGNCYIFGHSSDYVWSKGKYKTVFALLPRIKKGDIIQITDGDGNSFAYKVTESFVASAKDTYLLEQDKSKKILTLQTSYPIGTALKRYIVRAEME